MESLKKLPRKERRRFLALCRKHRYMSPEKLLEEQTRYASYGWKEAKATPEIREIHAVLNTIGAEEGTRLWLEAYRDAQTYAAVYSAKPLPEGRDNKDVAARGNGDYWPNKRRQPSLKRGASTWRKYLRLFSEDKNITPAEALAARDAHKKSFKRNGKLRVSNRKYNAACIRQLQEESKKTHV